MISNEYEDGNDMWRQKVVTRWFKTLNKIVNEMSIFVEIFDALMLKWKTKIIEIVVTDDVEHIISVWSKKQASKRYQ